MTDAVYHAARETANEDQKPYCFGHPSGNQNLNKKTAIDHPGNDAAGVGRGALHSSAAAVRVGDLGTDEIGGSKRIED